MKPTNLKLIRQTPREQLIRFTPYIASGIILVILPLVLPTYFHSLLTKILIFAIFAMSLDIIMGYTGLPSLGHAAFLGVAGYTVSILLVLHGIDNFWIIAPLGILAATIAAAILGIIALRVSGIYFLLVTFALGMLLFSMALKWYWLTRGSEGLPMVAYPELGLPWLTWNYTSFYYFVFIFFVICFFLMHRLVNSPFGHALQGIRENETRMRALGYNTWLYKYVAFIIAGLFAGVAGVLFPYYAKVMMPYSVGFTYSALVMLICIIGGLGTLWGPVVGAVAIILLEYFSSLYIPDRWPLVLGGAFAITVMFLRGGIAPHLVKLWRRMFYGSAKS
jgi:branched-chain amino acid transport system permease protein